MQTKKLDPVKVYIDCTVAQATVLEPSGEPADIIAAVVLSKCDKFVKDAAATLSEEWLANPKVKALPNDLREPRGVLDEANIKTLRESGRSAVLQVVVEDRARRASKIK